ncbi:chemotaxis protein [Comamonas aquatica DA1877]|uniref:Chemotaxis protein n=1 Tax=Comamonas aquatica DA1877 TaxID=1457173 RepID=A0A014QD28_9BURK|nr:methyl-accepting chemotaxis protein [Comamonas aquatica]EXU81102.1 chemotaxis protein [Comamonas aquatica DA1877]
MNLNIVRVAPKLWATILGLLVVMMLSNLWVRSNTERALEQARTDVQQIERKIALAQHMRGAAMTGLELGIAQFATNENRLQIELEKRFEQRRVAATEALQAMEAALHDEADRAQFARVLQARDAVQTRRAETEQNLDLDDYNARANFAFGDYAAMGVKYSQAFDEFVQYQIDQLDVVTQRAEARRQRSVMVGWGVAGLLLLVAVVMARWLVVNITRPLQQAVQLTATIGGGDLNVAAKTDRRDEFGHLMNALDAMAERLRQVVSEVRSGVGEVSEAAAEIAKGNADLSTRTEQTAANLEQTAASIEQLTATVHQSADTSRQANQLAATAVQAAERGGAVVQQVVHSMDQIHASSRKISDIIGVIDGIVFQTNILALNAAVEAARAGEQGRGFAVVAGEVRTLAQRSAEAAKEIKGLIEASVGTVALGADQVGQAGQSMQEIVASVRRVTDLIGEITAAANEQRDGFGQVNQAVSNLDQMTQQNAALVEESSAAAQAMHEQAQRLMQTMAVFQVGASTAAGQAMTAPPFTSTPTPQVAARAPVAPAPTVRAPAAPKAVVAPRTVASSKPAVSPDSDWETF